MATKTPAPFAYSDHGYEKAVCLTFSRGSYGSVTPTVTVVTAVANREDKAVRWVDGDRELFAGWGDTGHWNGDFGEWLFDGRLHYGPCGTNVSGHIRIDRMMNLAKFGVQLQNRIQKMRAREGVANNIGQWTNWLARGIGATVVVVIDRTDLGGETTYFCEPAAAVASITQLTRTIADRQPKATAAA